MELESRNKHPGAQWFPKAGLGIMFHWGISSLDGMVDISWGMYKDKYSPRSIPPQEYFDLANRFNPTRFNPDGWIKAAKEAGCRYAVLTTRHHDSYCLWPTEYGEFNTRNYMGGRDLVQGYVDACRKYGLKIGFYYSPPDFYTPRNYFGYNGYQEKKEVPKTLDDYVRAMAKGQIYELLTRYGKIDLLWFDGKHEAIISDEEIKELQPWVIIGRGENRDFGSTECRLPSDEEYEREFKGKWWEYVDEISNCWAYTCYDEWHNKPMERLTENFKWVREHNGNVLYNIGPGPYGDLPEHMYNALAEFGKYVKAHPELMPEWDED